MGRKVNQKAEIFIMKNCYPLYAHKKKIFNKNFINLQPEHLFLETFSVLIENYK